MAMQTIGKMSLDNEGGFVARIQFAYMDDNGQMRMSSQSGDVTLGRTDTVDPSSLGVPDDSTVWMYVFVVWGKDNQAQQAFKYSSGNGSTANYSISGTTLSNSLGLVSVT